MFIGTVNVENEGDTKLIAENLSKICTKGDVIALDGEMGSGKTTFARFFIKKFSSCKTIPSPTYNLLFSYKSKHLTIYHLDAWRIKSEDEFFSLGIEEMFEDSIFIIEWANKITNVLPEDCLYIAIKIKNKFRELTFKGNKNWNNRLIQFSFNE
tara:strand:- start:187 stop:648 length:462 start_codon:yes stop_codon:yes gene_type:complete